MAKADKKDEKIILEREYIIPLRREWLKVPRYKRASKAIKAIKQFLAKHMKVEDRDTRKVKLDKFLNEEIWFRGIKKPPAKIKVKARKYSDRVEVELAEIPEAIKFKVEREKKKAEKGKEVKKEKEAEKPEEKKEEVERLEETVEEKKEKEEKKEAVKEVGLREAEMKAKEMKHEVRLKKEPKHKFRQALQK